MPWWQVKLGICGMRALEFAAGARLDWMRSWRMAGGGDQCRARNQSRKNVGQRESQPGPGRWNRCIGFVHFNKLDPTHWLAGNTFSVSQNVKKINNAICSLQRIHLQYQNRGASNLISLICVCTHSIISLPSASTLFTLTYLPKIKLVHMHM